MDPREKSVRGRTMDSMVLHISEISPNRALIALNPTFSRFVF